MRTILFTLLIGSTLFAQRNIDKGLEKVFSNWENGAEISEVQADFSKLVKKNPIRWEPLYYAIMTQVINGFEMTPDNAEKLYPKLDTDLKKLKEIYPDSSERKTLEAFFLTLKLSKNPMQLGASLTPRVKTLYNEAIRENSKNGRALYLLSQINMESAKYMGQDPKNYCKNALFAVSLLEEEAKEEPKGYEPRWGLDYAKELSKKFCSN